MHICKYIAAHIPTLPLSNVTTVADQRNICYIPKTMVILHSCYISNTIGNTAELLHTKTNGNTAKLATYQDIDNTAKQDTTPMYLQSSLCSLCSLCQTSH
jgi:hypothetical protein